jgi:DNA gyrase subunit B
MNPDQLKVTTMDRAAHAGQDPHRGRDRTDRLFGLLMGGSVEPRRLFIEENAMEVTNLDI